MAFEAVLGLSNPLLSIAFLSVAILASAFLYAFQRPALPKNAPPLVTEAWPIIGSMQFFTKRWEFFQTPDGTLANRQLLILRWRQACDRHVRR